MVNVPGSNLLNQALRVIAKSTFQYLAFTGNTINSIGLKVPAYAAPITASGSVQPVPQNMYAQLGLDLQKTYFNFFVSKNIIDVNRDVTGDKFIFQGVTYLCESNTPWYGIDGWVQVLTIKVSS